MTIGSTALDGAAIDTSAMTNAAMNAAKAGAMPARRLNAPSAANFPHSFISGPAG
jgi:hypothetical protein